MWSVLRDASVIILGVVLVAACAPNVPPQIKQSVAQAGDFSENYYRQAQAQGKNILQVDPSQSLLVLEVRRAGAFARLGHDHVVASHDVKGYVEPDAGRADLMLRLDELSVDEAPLRAQAGFDTQPTPDDIAGTRHNMLTKVLETDRYPQALIHITRMRGADVLNVAITLHGTTRSFEVPATIDMNADGITVTGTMHFNQTDFGIVPYAILNGAIQVQDRLDLRFRIVAKKIAH
jgi:polyisoprenoid-binding protein YceI